MTVFQGGCEISLSSLKSIGADGLSPQELTAMHMLTEYTQSSLTTMMRCDQKFWLRYVLGIVPRSYNSSLVVGNMVHLFFEQALPHIIDYDPAEVSRILHICKNQWSKMVDKIIAQNTDTLAGNDYHKLSYCQAQATAMCEAWFLANGESLADKYTLVSSEQNIRGNPKPQDDHFLYHCAGKIDAVLVSRTDPDEWWVMEHKTRSRMDTLNAHDLMTDFQANFYIALAVYRLYDILSQHADALKQATWKGFQFNAIKKPQHRVKKGTNDYSELASRMKEAMLDRPEDYFFLERIPITIDTVNMAMSDAGLVVDLIKEMSVDKIIRRTTACHDYGGCVYLPLCQMGANAKDLDSILNNPNIRFFEGRAEHEELDHE